MVLKMLGTYECHKMTLLYFITIFKVVQITCEYHEKKFGISSANFRRKNEGNVLFNDTLNIFYLWLNGRKCFI